MDPTVKVNGKEYPFVMEADLTLGEAAEIERITGQGYDLTRIGALGLLALTYISVKRHEPLVRLEELELLTGSDIEVNVGEEETVPPLSPAASNEPASSSGGTSSSDSAGSPDETRELSGIPV